MTTLETLFGRLPLSLSQTLSSRNEKAFPLVTVHVVQHYANIVPRAPTFQYSINQSEYKPSEIWVRRSEICKGLIHDSRHVGDFAMIGRAELCASEHSVHPYD